MVEKEVIFALNDTADAIKKLAEAVHETNPGIDLSFIDFLLERIDRSIASLQRS